jgi:hypothetical protein
MNEYQPQPHYDDLPGGPVAEHDLYQRQKTNDGEVITTPDGQVVRLGQNESLVLVGGTSHREAFIRDQNGLTPLSDRLAATEQASRSALEYDYNVLRSQDIPALPQKDAAGTWHDHLGRPLASAEDKDEAFSRHLLASEAHHYPSEDIYQQWLSTFTTRVDAAIQGPDKTIGLFVSSKGITDHDRPRLSLLRQILREKGYRTIGKFAFNQSAHTANAQIEKDL